MGSMIGTCGHDVSEEFDINGFANISCAIATKDIDWDEGGFANTVSHVVYCEKCKRKAKRDGVILESEAEEHAWMDGDLKIENPY
ncbi:hypothetical protein LCGC14_1670480 [marine sediment metagenome]|uniref:Uncharacterized protein n=1 Tax=marine sediment metagenome TaxID=412755 RepID=A0A0F9HSC8_9ZZZZ